MWINKKLVSSLFYSVTVELHSFAFSRNKIMKITMKKGIKIRTLK